MADREEDEARRTQVAAEALGILGQYYYAPDSCVLIVLRRVCKSVQRRLAPFDPVRAPSGYAIAAQLGEIGSLELTRWMRLQYTDRYAIDTRRIALTAAKHASASFSDSSENTHLNLLDRCAPIHNSSPEWNIVQIACEHGNQALLSWAVGRNFTFGKNKEYRVIIEKGHLPLLQYVEETMQVTWTSADEPGYTYCSQWPTYQGVETQLPQNAYLYLFSAISSGQLEILQWVLSKYLSVSSNPVRRLDVRIVETLAVRAFMEGQVPVLQYLVDQATEPLDMMEFAGEIMERIRSPSSYGNLYKERVVTFSLAKAFTWLESQLLHRLPHIPVTASWDFAWLVHHAGLSYDVELLDWLDEKYRENWGTSLPRRTMSDFLLNCTRANVSLDGVRKWFLEPRAGEDQLESPEFAKVVHKLIVNSALKHRDYPILRWTLTHPDGPRFWSTEIYHELAKQGMFDLIQELYAIPWHPLQTMTNEKDRYTLLMFACAYAAEQGDIRFLTWASAKYPVDKWQPHISAQATLPALKWLRERNCPWTIRNLYYNLTYERFEVFIWSVLHGIYLTDPTANLDLDLERIERQAHSCDRVQRWCTLHRCKWMHTADDAVAGNIVS